MKEPSTAESFVDILLPFLTKKHQNIGGPLTISIFSHVIVFMGLLLTSAAALVDTCVNVLQIIRQVVTVLGSGSSKKLLNSISPLLISADLAVRNSICDVLDAVALKDASLSILVMQA